MTPHRQALIDVAELLEKARLADAAGQSGRLDRRIIATLRAGELRAEAEAIARTWAATPEGGIVQTANDTIGAHHA